MKLLIEFPDAAVFDYDDSRDVADDVAELLINSSILRGVSGITVKPIEEP